MTELGHKPLEILTRASDTAIPSHCVPVLSPKPPSLDSQGSLSSRPKPTPGIRETVSQGNFMTELLHSIQNWRSCNKCQLYTNLVTWKLLDEVFALCRCWFKRSPQAYCSSSKLGSDQSLKTSRCHDPSHHGVWALQGHSEKLSLAHKRSLFWSRRRNWRAPFNSCNYEGLFRAMFSTCHLSNHGVRYIETITLTVKLNMVIQIPQADPSRTITSLSSGARPGVSAKLVSASEVQARVYYYGAFLGSQRKGINGRGILPVVAHPRELNIPNTLRFLPLSRY